MGLQVMTRMNSIFMSLPVLSLNQCPIAAWDDIKSVYPNLFKLSRKYVHLIGTSVPSERLFSKAGAIATIKRAYPAPN